MNRLLATMRLDMTLQFRNGFYYVSAAVVVLFVVALRTFFDQAGQALALPALFLVGLAGSTYIFVAGLLLFEKGQRTLDGIIVTPLRSAEYLTAKLVTLTLLATLESLLITLLTYGFGFNPLLLIAGIAGMGLFYTLIGLVVVVRYESVTDFLLPSTLYTVGLQLPLIDYFGIWQSPLFYLFPTQPALLLMRAAFEPIATWQLAYAIVGSVAAVGATYLWASRAFDHFIVQQKRSA